VFFDELTPFLVELSFDLPVSATGGSLSGTSRTDRIY